MSKPKQPNRYAETLVWIFEKYYKPGDTMVPFERDDLAEAAKILGIEPPKNLGDIVYSFRYRASLPGPIASRAPDGMVWSIVGVGPSKYEFQAAPDQPIVPNTLLRTVKVPDSTPGIIAQHVMGSEQALLAKVRYNRLIDIFTGIVCYSLQNHLRTNIPGVGQIETDEVYLGVDRSGTQYVIPIEAKGGSDKLSVVQIKQDLALAKHRFPNLDCRLVGAQFDREDIFLYLFQERGESGEIELLTQSRFRLVEPAEIDSEELRAYRDA